ncbi:hypothetical protein Tco_0446497 [Tanacetum coccineum]
MVGKKKKRKCKSKSTNGGQFVGPLVKQNVRYEPKVTTSAPKKGITNVEEDDEEEDVKNVYDESANLFQNTKTGGSSSFTAAAVIVEKPMAQSTKQLVYLWHLKNYQHPKHAPIAKVKQRIPKIKGVGFAVEAHEFETENDEQTRISIIVNAIKYRAERGPAKTVVENQEGDAVKRK